jgi:hypothetical protein
MRERPRFSTWLMTAGLGLALVVALGACTGLSPSNRRPATVYVPDLMGRITGAERDADTDVYRVTVRGHTVEISPGARALTSAGADDSLLIYGVDDSTTWYATLTRISTGNQEGCYGLSTYNAWDSGDSIVFGFPLDAYEDPDFGVLLPKADSWDDAWDESVELGKDDRYPVQFRGWCLDETGEVKSVEEHAAA